MKLKLKKLFKCNINNCSNLVASNGAFCKSCLDKIINDNYIIPICSVCNRVIDLIKIDKTHKNINDRILQTICYKCYQKLENEEMNNH